MEGRLYPLVAIAGPTGSGKSELALAVAARFGGEIVNCDSVQVYRGFDIGAAKLPLERRRGVPHHLIDIAEPEELFTAGEYARLGRAALDEIAGRGRLPVIAGGTGFYLRALLDGLSFTPPRDEALRGRLRAREDRRPGGLHRLLKRLDPPAALKIHANDLQKTTRALELRILRAQASLGLPPPEPLTGFQILKIGLEPPRELLYRRLDARLEAMFAGGLLEEVRGLLAQGVSAQAKPFESLGYKEALQVVLGQLTRETALAAAQQYTRNYAKRQLTWFRREAGMQWIRGFGDAAQVQDQAGGFITSGLQRPLMGFSIS